MKRPSFQFYPADWKNNSKLRRCSEAARGAWVDVLCVLHDSDEYGVCRWPLAELARAAGINIKLVRELVSKNVLKGSDSAAQDYVYTPRHAGKAGAPVVLVTAGTGPCWYCSRFVRDEYVRQRRGIGSRFSEDNQPTKDGDTEEPKIQPKGGFGTRQGDGPTSTSTSTSTKEENNKGKTKRSGAPRFDAYAELIARGVQPDTARDWLVVRKAKRAPLTATALKDVIAEADRAGMSLERAVAYAVKKGWAGFDSQWVLRDTVPQQQTRQTKSQALVDRITGRTRNEHDSRIIDIN